MNLTDIEALPVHPYADAYPLIEGPELDGLVASVKESGVRVPLLIFNGSLMDGRNRLRAARLAGLAAIPTEHRDGNPSDALRIVRDLNGQRRHLTVSQRAAIGADLANIEIGAYTGNQHEEPSRNSDSPPLVSLQAAAETVGVSRDSVATAVKVKKADPELHEQVKAGKVTLNAAKTRVSKAKRAAPPPPPPPPPAPDRDPFFGSPELEEALSYIDASLDTYFPRRNTDLLQRVSHLMHETAIPRLQRAVLKYEREQFRKRNHAVEHQLLKDALAEAQARLADERLLRLSPVHGITFDDYRKVRLTPHPDRQIGTMPADKQRQLYEFLEKLAPYFEAEKRHRERVEKAKARKAAA